MKIVWDGWQELEGISVMLSSLSLSDEFCIWNNNMHLLLSSAPLRNMLVSSLEWSKQRFLRLLCWKHCRIVYAMIWVFLVLESMTHVRILLQCSLREEWKLILQTNPKIRQSRLIDDNMSGMSPLNEVGHKKARRANCDSFQCRISNILQTLLYPIRLDDLWFRNMAAFSWFDSSLHECHQVEISKTPERPAGRIQRIAMLTYRRFVSIQQVSLMNTLLRSTGTELGRRKHYKKVAMMWMCDLNGNLKNISHLASFPWVALDSLSSFKCRLLRKYFSIPGILLKHWRQLFMKLCKRIRPKWAFINMKFIKPSISQVLQTHQPLQWLHTTDIAWASSRWNRHQIVAIRT